MPWKHERRSDVELRTLRYFVATVDEGTVSAAALALHVTQPALSRQLRQLERELRVDLFDRTGGRLRLSAAGRALLPRARDLLARAGDLETAAAIQARGELERLTVAAPTTTLTDVVSPFVVTLEPDDPTPSVLESDGLSAQDALREGADLVITIEIPPAELASMPLAPLHVFAYVPRDHPWAGRRTVSVAELSEVPLVGLPRSSSARRALDLAVAGLGVPPLRLLEASNGTIAQALAAAGRGVAVVSDDPRFDLVPLTLTAQADEPVAFRLHCAWSPHHPGAAVIERIAARIAAWTAQQYGQP